MIVMKFGGTSVGDAAHIRVVEGIVRQQLRRKPALVISAHSGVTNMLDELAKKAVRGSYSLDALREKHVAILRDLSLPLDLQEPFFKELDDLLRGISLVGELTPRSLDYVLSFGERLSVRAVAAHFNRAGLPAVAMDAFDAGLTTDSNHGRARPLPESYAEIKKRVVAVNGLAVITGYIAKDTRGNITTLGRNGSDYSGAIFGNALDAEEIQIWTDVDGVLTADPRIVPDARPLAEISFDEASELAYYGGKVLHPATLLPAVAKNIPVRVLNTKNPSSPGTVILKEAKGSESPVRSIVSKSNLFLINVSSTRMLGQPGFMAKLFAVFDRHEIVIDMIATTEVSVSMTTDSNRNLDEAVRELRTFADVTVESGLAIVCVVGHGIKDDLGVAGTVFSTLASKGIRVRMISQGALKVNVGMLVEGKDMIPAVKALHEAFFSAVNKAASHDALLHPARRS